MASKKPAKDLLSNLRATSTPAPDESQPLTQPLAAPPPAPRLDYVPFANRLTVENKLMLDRVHHFVPGASIVNLLNDALNAHLRTFPESQQPLPSELPRT